MFGAEVAKESARNEKIAKKNLKANSRAYAYAPKGAYAYALPCLGRHVLAGTGPYAYAPKGSMQTSKKPEAAQGGNDKPIPSEASRLPYPTAAKRTKKVKVTDERIIELLSKVEIDDLGAAVTEKAVSSIQGLRFIPYHPDELPKKYEDP
ncbi:hypothetical protein PIB30_044154 [Stylosanthes scabra]|uniref:Uncharacterized protein n=1 Tax=Stylosanthes scabra TaxID=79078 RepID=A0ABU6VH75_9FABA|nr:hypothetical protein [Stylosanthes scabra]